MENQLSFFMFSGLHRFFLLLAIRPQLRQTNLGLDTRSIYSAGFSLSIFFPTSLQRLFPIVLFPINTIFIIVFYMKIEIISNMQTLGMSIFTVDELQSTKSRRLIGDGP